MNGIQIYNDGKFNSVSAVAMSIAGSFGLPILASSAISTNLSQKGQIAYDNLDGRIMYSDGINWQILGTGGVGTVIQVNTGTGLTGGPITTSGTISLSPVGPGPSSYTLANITINAQGQITTATNGSAVTQIVAGTGLTGGIITNTGTINIDTTGVTSAMYTNPTIFINPQGQITSAVNGSAGTITQINTGTGLTGGPITTSGTISLSPVGPGASSYTLANITINAEGQITTASNGSAVTSITAGTGLSGGTITSTGTISLSPVGPGASSYTLANITINAEGQITTATNGSAVTQIVAGTGLSGGTITSTGTISLPTLINPAPVSYTNANITLDAQGRITSASNGSVGTGTVTSISASPEITLTPSPITTTGTISITPTGVTSGHYTNPILDINALGQVTTASNGSAVTSLSAGTGITLTPNPTTTTGTISITPTGVTATSYNLANITVNAEGQITTASNGSTTINTTNTSSTLSIPSTFHLALFDTSNSNLIITVPDPVVGTMLDTTLLYQKGLSATLNFSEGSFVLVPSDYQRQLYFTSGGWVSFNRENYDFFPTTQQSGPLIGTGGTTSGQGDSISLSVDGTTVAIGGPNDTSGLGAVWIFTKTAGVWTQQGGKLVGTGGTGAAQHQGTGVALSSDGNTLAFGGPGDGTNVGAVWVFTRTAGVWTQQGAKIQGSGGTLPSFQGSSVALSADGNTLASGAPDNNGTIGATWIFTRTAGVWTQQGSLLVGTGSAGANTNQGISVALASDGNTLAIGGHFDNSQVGATWIFTRSGGVWTQQGSKMVGTGGVGTQQQGNSVTLSADGNTMASGGNLDNSGIGATWIFTRSGGLWTQQGNKMVGTGGINAPQQGTSVSFSGDGNTLAVGGPGDNTGIGATWIFTRIASDWTQQGTKLIASGNTGPSAQGDAVSLSSNGNTLATGGPTNNTNVGAVWIFT